MMKFALFLVCALVAVQGFQARSVEPSERDLNDIIDAIKRAIEKLKEIISNITSQIPELIENIKEKIKEIAGRIQEIVSNIRDKIEDLIALGEKGKKCVEQHRTVIENLIKDAQDGLQGCVKEAESQTEGLRKQVEVLVSKVTALQNDITNRVVKCIQDNKLNPVALFNCLRKQVGPIGDQVSEVQQEVANTVFLAQETAQKVVATLTECTQEVSAEIAQREEDIINSIKSCIEQA